MINHLITCFFKKNLAIILILMCSLPAMAELELRISKTTDDGIPIYLANIPGGANGIIEADLKRSGRFTVIDRNQIADIASYGSVLNAGAYSSVADYIVRGKPLDGGLEIELTSTSDNAKTIYNISSSNNFRRVAHQAADKIYEKVTREKGAFDTRLAYVTVTNKTTDDRMFRLYVADSDGHNPKAILASRLPVMSPDWSPNAQNLAYVSFEESTSAIYVQNIFTGEKKKISAREGINGAPAWSPDGNKLAMSLSVEGSPDIYIVNVQSGQLSRITTSSAIDTEPVWDGPNSIIFTSNRGGGPQLYRIAASGGSAKRLTFDGKENSAADIANKKLAYVTGKGIALRSVDSSGFDALSNGQLDESPTLSPNGAMVAYTTLKDGDNTLAVVSDNTKARQFLISPAGDVREPAWSPYLNR